MTMPSPEEAGNLSCQAQVSPEGAYGEHRGRSPCRARGYALGYVADRTVQTHRTIDP